LSDAAFSSESLLINSNWPRSRCSSIDLRSASAALRSYDRYAGTAIIAAESVCSTTLPARLRRRRPLVDDVSDDADSLRGEKSSSLLANERGTMPASLCGRSCDSDAVAMLTSSSSDSDSWRRAASTPSDDDDDDDSSLLSSPRTAGDAVAHAAVDWCYSEPPRPKKRMPKRRGDGASSSLNDGRRSTGDGDSGATRSGGGSCARQRFTLLPERLRLSLRRKLERRTLLRALPPPLLLLSDSSSEA
jgi:hypothetical protein